MLNIFKINAHIHGLVADQRINLIMRRKHRGAVDYVVEKVAREGWQAFEPPLPSVVTSISRLEQSGFLDIGANSGFYALLAQQMGCREIFAYEPVSSIAQALTINASLTLKGPEHKLGGAGFHIVRKAVGSAPGKTTIYLPPQDHGLLETSASLNSTFKEQHGAVEEVEVTTIDNEYRKHQWSTQRAWTVKIDVESWEEEVLRGATQFIQEVRPVLICEILPRPGVQTACFTELCARHHYSAFHLCSPNLVVAVDDGNFVRPSANNDWNYLFVPDDKAARLLEALNQAGLSLCD